MSNALEEIEAGLRAHFEHLAAAKTATGYPVFALEHNLSTDALKEMRGYLYADFRRRAMYHEFKHCWIVHAAEHGYTFQGQEFWQTFAGLTPGWEYLGDRWRLRDWFSQFAARYNGVRPVGRWGARYPYISWPITNALLPNDLQVHLARALYDMRYRLDDLIQLQYVAAGQMVAQQAEFPSSRFKHFLEQHELVGRLVRALLEGDPEDAVIYRPTLQRITCDLDAKHDARAWLKDVRQVYAQFRAKLAPPNPTYSVINPALDFEADDTSDPTTELNTREVMLLPRLQLRRISSGRWEAVVLIPSFQSLISAKQKFREHLTRARYRMPAHGSALYPGLSLISGRPVPRRLTKWPAERTPLLQFTLQDKLFDAIVNTECQLVPSKLWVFHCHEEDGYAVHIQGQHMRPGQNYIVVAREARLLSRLGDSVALECEDIFAARLCMPSVTSAELAETLKAANIALHSKVEIEPVGLRPRQWTDEGSGEWLSTENPLFALSCDHECTGFQIKIDDQATQFIVRSPLGATLISLKNLSVGRHDVLIAAVVIQKDAFGSRSRHVAQSVLNVSIRHPTNWSPRMQLPSAMLVETDPAVPTLEDFLSRRLQLQVDGDDSRKATCSVVLVSSADGKETVLPIFEHSLPISISQWSEALKTFIKKSDDLQFITASSIFLVVEAEDLGERRIELHHDPEPVRWAQKKGKPATLLLINEGVQEEVNITYFNFDHPLKPVQISEMQATRGIQLQDADGLYLASWPNQTTSIIVAPADKIRGLSSLGAHVDSAELARGVSVGQLLDACRLWRSARASGYMAEIKQNSVVEILRQHLYGKLCGVPWAHQEKALFANPNDEHCWEALEGAVYQQPSFAISLRNVWLTKGGNSDFDARSQFCSIARSFSRAFDVHHDPEECALIWQIAADPVALTASIDLHGLTARRHFIIWLKAARLLWLCQSLKRSRV